jgi:hypothetical protein
MEESDTDCLRSDDWTVVRDFEEGEAGHRFPRYEAKYVEDVEQTFVENDVVLLKETFPSEKERIYHLPKSAFQGAADRLP